MTLTRSTDETISAQFVPATMGARARAVIIDAVLISILAVLLMGASILLLDRAHLGVLAGILVGLVLLREIDLMATGRSLGSRLAGVRFVDVRTGGTPGIGMFFHADLVLVTIVPTLGFGSFLLLRSAAKSPDGRGWHDRVSGLMAVSTTALADDQEPEEPSSQSSSGDLEEVPLDLFGEQAQARPRRRGAHVAPEPGAEVEAPDQSRTDLPPATPKFHAVPTVPAQDLAPDEALPGEDLVDEVGTVTGPASTSDVAEQAAGPASEPEAFVVVPPEDEVSTEVSPPGPDSLGSQDSSGDSPYGLVPEAPVDLAPGAPASPVDSAFPDTAAPTSPEASTSPNTAAPTSPVDSPSPDTAAPTSPDTAAPTSPDTAAPTSPDTAAPTSPDTAAPFPQAVSPLPATGGALAPTPEPVEDEIPGAVLPDISEADLDTAVAEPVVVPPLAASKAAVEALDSFNAPPATSLPSPDFVALPPEPGAGPRAASHDSALSPGDVDVPAAPRSAPSPSESDDHYELIQEVFERRAAARAAQREALSVPDEAAADAQASVPSAPSAPSPEPATSPEGSSGSKLVDDTLIEASLADGRTTDEPMIVVPEGESLDSYFAQSLIGDDPDAFSAASPEHSQAAVPEPVSSEGTEGPSPAFVDDRESPVMRLMPFTNTGKAVQILGPTIIGRAPVNTSRYPEAQLVALGDSAPSVSKTHAALMPTDHGVLVTDLGSSNGTRVVRKGKARRIPQDVAVMVHEGGVVLLGQTAYRVQR